MNRGTDVHYHLAPIACKPWALSGLSERLIVGHYENEYGAAVRSLNTIFQTLDDLDFAAEPAYVIRALKRDELAARASVMLHELYFGTLGGDGATLFTGAGPGTKMVDSVSTALEEQFGGMAKWRREFVAIAQAAGDSSSWVVLNYSHSDGRLSNQIVSDHSPAMIDAVPLLALDMYEHAYHLDFGANASAYIDAFMRNIDWRVVSERLVDATRRDTSSRARESGESLPSVSVEEVAAQLANGERIQVLDARPKHYFSRSTDMLRGATWRDPDRIDEWSKQLSADAPVVVYCAYGYAVGCGVTSVLRERGFDAKYIRGGLSAWYAAGGERALKPSTP